MSRPASPSSVDGDANVAAATGTPMPWQTASCIVAWYDKPSIVSFVVEPWLNTRLHTAKFDAGGYNWCVKIYPDGRKGSANAGWVSVFLQLLGGTNIDGEMVMAQFSVSLLDQDGEPVPSYSRNRSKIKPYASKDQYGLPRLIAGHELKRYLRDDRFRLKYDVVVHRICAKPADAPRPVVVPPSDLQRQLLALLRSERGGDVTFDVSSELFTAHRYMLAACSSVFMAELFGPMSEKAAGKVQVDDMEPRVFEAMLEFIYTDSLPKIDGGEKVEMAQHLLVAADRYNLERLKLIWEDMLCGNIDKSTVATTLTLAEQHGCCGLKEACFNFLSRIPGNLEAVMASDDFQHLKTSCPSLVQIIIDQATAVSGSHVLKIDGYSQTKGLGNGRCVTSMVFVIGGRHWSMQYYPDGQTSEDAGWISIVIMCNYTCDDDEGAVKARYEINLLGQDRNPVPVCSRASSSPREFSHGRGHGGKLIERSVLEGSGYLKDDAFSVRCDITILE
ncbi:BTB/POZ and MATH domain-containing protein 2 [Triticum aestivum]|uniref:BTB/POZ and MATH domain-containing protein 2 n=1 Tax=Triticum aestivum TaxID=4565 RepID=UPI0008441417|nr:BTB/POZ and MATH domain-containing protein 2-like [Triticum aestivum]